MLPEPHRLRHRHDFECIRREGQKIVTRLAVVLHRPNGLDTSRFAFSASRRVGNAVQRNRARRLLREAVRIELAKAPNGYDLLFVARQRTPTSSVSEIRNVVQGVFRALSRQQDEAPDNQTP